MKDAIEKAITHKVDYLFNQGKSFVEVLDNLSDEIQNPRHKKNLSRYSAHEEEQKVNEEVEKQTPELIIQEKNETPQPRLYPVKPKESNVQLSSFCRSF